MTSFSMLRACALVIGPLGACGGDGVLVRVVEGCSASGRGATKEGRVSLLGVPA